MKRYYTVILSILLLFVFTGCDNENGVISPSATIGWGGSLTERPVQPISFGTVEEALSLIHIYGLNFIYTTPKFLCYIL